MLYHSKTLNQPTAPDALEQQSYLYLIQADDLEEIMKSINLGNAVPSAENNISM